MLNRPTRDEKKMEVEVKERVDVKFPGASAEIISQGVMCVVQK